jgi:hypothetical protein
MPTLLNTVNPVQAQEQPVLLPTHARVVVRQD